MRITIQLLLFTAFLFITGCKGEVKEATDVMKCTEISSEISNQAITCFGEDRYGYIWIGTARGLNRFNGQTYHQYLNKNPQKSERNQINVIYKDSRQQLWVGTQNGILRYNEQDYFENIPIFVGDNNIMQIVEDKEGRIYANTSRHLLEYIPDSDRFIPRLRLKKGFNADFGINDPSHLCYVDSLNRIWIVGPSAINCYHAGSLRQVFSLKRDRLTHYYYSFLDKNGKLWFTSGRKLELLDTRKRNLLPIPAVIRQHPVLSQALIMNIQEYRSNILLINTNNNGLFLFDELKNKIIHQSENEIPFTVPAFKITALFKDSRKNIWIGSVDQGYNVVYSYSRVFDPDMALFNATKNKSVSMVSVDTVGNYWISTQSGELIIYNSNTRNYTVVGLHLFFPDEPFFQDKVCSVVHDGSYTWLLTIGGKLLKCIYQNNRLEQLNKYIVQAESYDIAKDKNGVIWIAASNGVYIVKPGSVTPEKAVSLPDNYRIKSKLTLLPSGKVFLCFSSNLPYIIDPDQMTVRIVELNKEVFSNQYTPNDVYTDSEGDVWIGTADNGLYLYRTKTGAVEKIEGLFSNDVYSIIEDYQGKIWVGTSQGLIKLDKKTFQSVTLFKNDGIGGNQFNEGAVFAMSNHTLIFGGTHGLTMFKPENIIAKKKVSLLFEDLWVKNQLIKPEIDKEIDKSLAFKPKIRLKYNQNDINISFTAVDYSEFPRIRYFYKLEGYDNSWMDSHENRFANYSSLPAGRYTFKVRITSLDNTTVLAENSISLYIARAPWVSIPAIIFYLLLVLALVWYVVHLYTTIKINKAKAIIANKEKEHEIYINKMNQNFFTNISHEFRTPLTMIAGPVAALYKDKKLSAESRQLLEVVRQGVDRMLRLVNQVLSFNKLDNDALRLRVASVDVTHELVRLTDFFRPGARQKGVQLNTAGLEETWLTWLDKDKFEDVIMNILSNAIKFTTEGDQINLRLERLSGTEAGHIFPLKEKETDYDYIKVSVEDTGIGIPQDKLEVIFQRFTQLNEANRFSTGIGLYYVRRLIELHHGYIRAEQGREKGACFSFILPMSQEAYSTDEISLICEEDNAAYIQPDYHVQSSSDVVSSTGIYTILMVDDDLEISNYVKIILEPYYRIINKHDAESAIQAIEDEVPDLILSDVLMPGMDGFQFCRKIKENDSYSHIPFVLLTAKSMVDDQIEGLEIGANAYVTKPFEPAYLLALIKSQLRNRELARNVLGNATKADAIAEDALSPRDRAFMKALYELMEKELASPDLNVTRMIDVFKMGRTKFFNKVKGLTGETPNTFFKTYKLNRAAELIEEGKYNLSEIADMTGFNTLSYFSVSFKKKFNVVPSEYMGTRK